MGSSPAGIGFFDYRTTNLRSITCNSSGSTPAFRMKVSGETNANANSKDSAAVGSSVSGAISGHAYAVECVMVKFPSSCKTGVSITHCVKTGIPGTLTYSGVSLWAGTSAARVGFKWIPSKPYMIPETDTLQVQTRQLTGGVSACITVVVRY